MTASLLLNKTRQRTFLWPWGQVLNLGCNQTLLGSGSLLGFMPCFLFVPRTQLSLCGVFFVLMFCVFFSQFKSFETIWAQTTGPVFSYLRIPFASSGMRHEGHQGCLRLCKSCWDTECEGSQTWCSLVQATYWEGQTACAVPWTMPKHCPSDCYTWHSLNPTSS